MFENIKQKLRDLAAAGRPPFDPSQFHDPLAGTIEWTPTKSGGANFCTHKLQPVLDNRLEFHATAGAKLFCLLFLTVGLGGLVGAGVLATRGNEGVWPVIVLGLFGLFFAAIGAGLLYGLTRPIVFDKASGYFWKGRKDPQIALLRNEAGDFTPLRDIHAIQLLSERQGSGKNRSSYYSYELNLVLQDGTRVNVVDHGHRARIVEDAQTLATFLGVAVWNAS